MRLPDFDTFRAEQLADPEYWRGKARFLRDMCRWMGEGPPPGRSVRAAECDRRAAELSQADGSV